MFYNNTFSLKTKLTILTLFILTLCLLGLYYRQEILTLNDSIGQYHYLTSSLLLTSFFIVFGLGNCIGLQKSTNQTPWAAIGIGLNGASSFGDNGTTGIGTPGVGGAGTGGTSSSGHSAGTPVNGMFFLHNDQVGSVKTITGANGEMITGSNGASKIVYGAYGDIDLNNSQGPDILRKKFTGQTLDNESGLYYYNARYYDPALGRFITADSVADTGGPNGLNRYMYTRGNPVLYNDPSGHDAPKWMENMKKDITKAMIESVVSQNPTAALLYMAQNKKHSSDYKKNTMLERNPAGWFDRQMINPIQHMSTSELIIGAIIFVAAFIITVMTFGAGGFLIGMAIGIGINFGGSVIGRQMGGYSGSSTNKLRWDSKKADRGQQIGGNAASSGALLGSLTAPLYNNLSNEISGSLMRSEADNFISFSDIADDFLNIRNPNYSSKFLGPLEQFGVGEALGASFDGGGSSLSSDNRNEFIKDPLNQNQNADARTIFIENRAYYYYNNYNAVQIYNNVLGEYTGNIICKELKDYCVPRY